MKKTISVIMALMLAFSMLLTAGADNASSDKLQFDTDGNFRIMQIADIQDGPFLPGIVTDFFRAVIPEAKPDLIVLTGDNISAGGSSVGIHGADLLLVEVAIDRYMSIFEEFGIPVAVVFGNHDAEELVSKEEQLAMYQKYDNCLAYDADEALYGCGTYNLPVYSSKDANKIAYNLWMFDSNMYDETNGGYDYVHQDQIDWYVNKSNELKAQNGGAPVPSMLFQHIIVNEIYDALLEVSADTAGAMEKDGKYYILNPENTADGSVLRESPCPGTLDSNQFEAAVAQGDMVAMFFGHDHKNNFIVEHQGIDLVNTPGAGFGSYGDDGRGVRIIDIKEGTTDYETEVVTYREYYGDDPVFDARFTLHGSEFEVIDQIAAFFKYIILSVARILGC
ncbi:MAG: metallophosphoesterase family protein [Clostridia bacterium]|nr:metallophosphoesterase family protein [Clostridia bacterium]